MGEAPTEREMQILKLLWEHGEATVRDIYEAMREENQLAQTTVQTFLRLMEDKGLVRHRVRGRSFVYVPLYSRQRTLTRFLNRIFDGAVDQLVVHALKAKNLSDEEMEKLEEIIRQARAAKRKA